MRSTTIVVEPDGSGNGASYSVNRSPYSFERGCGVPRASLLSDGITIYHLIEATMWPSGLLLITHLWRVMYRGIDTW